MVDDVKNNDPILELWVVSSHDPIRFDTGVRIEDILTSTHSTTPRIPSSHPPYYNPSTSYSPIREIRGYR